MKTLLLFFITLLAAEIAGAQSLVPADFVLIKGGTFIMGSPVSEAWRGKDEVQHHVTVSDFYITKSEVTQKEYRDLMGSNPSNFNGDNLPVENITWYEAIQYCNARSRKEGLTPAYTITGNNVQWNRNAQVGTAGYRLPTEAEWEYACRAGTITPFNVGNNITVNQANWYGTYPYTIETHYFSQQELEVRPGEYRQRTVPAGSFAPNTWGLFDMHGNVWEWCWDYYGEYSTAAETDPTGAAIGSFRVHRGGGWNDFAKHIRSAYRAAMPPNEGMYNIGFRLARNSQ
jgi:formylglycine-generating enzyme required for sulfatase activity